MKLNYVGVPIWLNGRNYYVPSLSFPDFKANYEFLASEPDLSTGPAIFSCFDRVVILLGLAIRRNYPEVTDEQLIGWLDMNTLPDAIRAVRGASGLVPVSEGEDQPVASE